MLVNNLIHKKLATTVCMLMLVISTCAQNSLPNTFLYDGNTKCITLCDNKGQAIKDAKGQTLNEMYNTSLQDILALWDTSLVSKSFIVEFSVINKNILDDKSYTEIYKYKLKPVDDVIEVSLFPKKPKALFLSKYKAPYTIIYKSDNDNMYAAGIPLFIGVITDSEMPLDAFFED